MRALLDHYSPTGSWIVRSDDALPREFVVAGRKVTLSSSDSFAVYFPNGNPDRLVDQMNTAVHEVYHLISTRLGYQLLVDAKAPDLVRAEGVYTGGAPLLVEFSAMYPAREMATSFPTDAVTHGYAVYVSPSDDARGTQLDGVVGLLEEWTAYLHGSRTVLDFWPWVRDVAPRTRELYTIYRARFHGMWVEYAEFKLFILHYLVHARAAAGGLSRAHRERVVSSRICRDRRCVDCAPRGRHHTRARDRLVHGGANRGEHELPGRASVSGGAARPCNRAIPACARRAARSMSAHAFAGASGTSLCASSAASALVLLRKSASTSLNSAPTSSARFESHSQIKKMIALPSAPYVASYRSK